MREIIFKGKLQKIKPERLIRMDNEDRLADFFLVLGAFYNDLKSLTLHLALARNKFENVENPETPSVEAGEYGGIKSHLERLTAATLHEFLKFLYENREVLGTTEFYLLLKNLNGDLRERWETIVDIACGVEPKKKSPFADALALIRNNLAFHYYQSDKNLREGFSRYFFKDKKYFGNETAYYSIGNTMEETRFFFCDAAMQRSLAIQVERKMKVEEYSRELRSMMENVNFTIMRLMSIFIKERPY